MHNVCTKWFNEYAALQAEQEEFRKDHKEQNERYDEMTHQYELKVQALQAELSEAREHKAKLNIFVKSQDNTIEGLCDQICDLKDALKSAELTEVPK